MTDLDSATAERDEAWAFVRSYVTALTDALTSKNWEVATPLMHEFRDLALRGVTQGMTEAQHTAIIGDNMRLVSLRFGMLTRLVIDAFEAPSIIVAGLCTNNTPEEIEAMCGPDVIRAAIFADPPGD